MNKKTISIFLFVLLATFVLMRLGKTAQSSSSIPGVAGTAYTSALTASETVHDFGRISMVAGLVDKQFTITNPTGHDVLLKSIATSCMCTNAYLETGTAERGPFGMEGMGYTPPVNEVMKPGESRNIRVVYDPAAHGPAGVGIIDRFVYVTDEFGGRVVLEVKAVVTP